MDSRDHPPPLGRDRFFPNRGGLRGALSLERLAAKTQEIYEKTTDFKARFIQEVTIKSMKKTEREEGRSGSRTRR